MLILPLRPKIVKLARIIGSVTGIMTKIDENAPEYYSLVNIVSDDEADIAIAQLAQELSESLQKFKY